MRQAASIITVVCTSLLTAEPAPSGRDFWAFRPLGQPQLPACSAAAGPIDGFVHASLERKGLDFAPEADRRAFVRRTCLDLTGLPPSPEETDAFLADDSPDACSRLVDRLLASPHFAERWGQVWLDAAGYADSNGYHRNDTPRPLAHRYRDYVIRSVAEDKPYDRFILEQLAGDELVADPEKPHLTAEEVDALTATHFLRNAPDGTDSTEGNEMARTIERYAVLEGLTQITVSTLFGLTIDCARCHDHKFDPIPQRDYYALQAVFYPAFNVKSWVQPKDRWIYAGGREEVERWKQSSRDADTAAEAFRGGFESWLCGQQANGTVIFGDAFKSGSLASSWSPTAPGDSAKTGRPLVKLNASGGAGAPAASVDGGVLRLHAGAASDGAWLSTRESFDWTPERIGGWIEATFELVDLNPDGGKPAERIGYYLATHDHDDQTSKPGGNILIDGNPAGGADVHLDYPGPDSKAIGKIGASRYQAGRVYGVRVLRAAEDEYLLVHVVDGRLEPGMAELRAVDLPAGGFGFELCCSRSFAVRNVRVVSCLPTSPAAVSGSFAAELALRRQELATRLQLIEAQRLPEPPRIAWTTDLSPTPPAVPLLRRGDYFQPAEAIEPGVLSVLAEPDEPFQIEAPPGGARTTGRRLALARWAARPGSRAAALLARVEANRIWLGHFGRGLVETPENFGARGSRPSHPELLEWLARALIEGGWSRKHLHRQIVLSRAYRQASFSEAGASEVDPENRLLWQYPARRLDAESLRDSMLSVAESLDRSLGGPPVDFQALDDGEVVLPAPAGSGAVERRSIYLRHRRSQPVTFLEAFDQPKMDPNCLERSPSIVVSQALALLNGAFAVRTGERLAARIDRETASRVELDQGRRAEGWIERLFLVSLARPPSRSELESSAAFLARQIEIYRSTGTVSDPRAGASRDLARMLLAANEFAYIQ